MRAKKLMLVLTLAGALSQANSNNTTAAPGSETSKNEIWYWCTVGWCAVTFIVGWLRHLMTPGDGLFYCFVFPNVIPAAILVGAFADDFNYKLTITATVFLALWSLYLAFDTYVTSIEIKNDLEKADRIRIWTEQETKRKAAEAQAEAEAKRNGQKAIRFA